jgi:hypothetical protein
MAARGSKLETIFKEGSVLDGNFDHSRFFKYIYKEREL